jgi:tetratricopeptide (TPR) repeat protein
MINGGSAPLRRRHTRKAYHLGSDELKCSVMRARGLLTSTPVLLALAVELVLFLGLGLSGCAHKGGPAPEGPARALASEAGRIGRIAYEDDYTEARLVFQALPTNAAERAALRGKLLHYLLDPVLALNPATLRREVRDLESDDAYDVIFESFREALALYDPAELWSAPPRIPEGEQRQLRPAAEMVVALFSPRGGAEQVALALAALTTMAPDVRDWRDRLDQVIRWTDEANALGDRGPRKSNSAVDVLEGALGDWPAPAVITRLDALYLARQQRVVSGLRRPGAGESARRALGELLLAHGDEVQRAVVSMGGVYLRAGLIGEAARRTAALAGQTGDDPELRGLLVAAAKPDAAAADYLALARRFLPRIEFLGGTATESPDPLIALRVLEAGIARRPDSPELLVLSSHVARLLASYFLAIRRLEEAQALLERAPAAAGDLPARVSAELIELYFLRLRLRLDPERDTPAYAEADALKQRFVETRKRFQSAEMKVKAADIDFELARSYVNAGQIDRAEPLFLRARDEGEPTAEVTIELANLALKRGDPRRAAQIIREGLDALRAAQAQARDTIGSVEGRARLERLLGECTEASGDHNGAAAAWRSALIGWERLMIEHLRRKNLGESAEAAVEVGRLLYLLGRPAEGLQKFDEAIEADGDRDQTYIDVIAFLVQHGEADAALGIYHRGLSRPGRAVSEYVKVYTSLWVLDLSRRTSKLPDAKAEAFLRTLDRRHGELRPRRGAAWYHLLARYAVGQLSYEKMLAAADTTGKRAEIYFYEGMRRLADGKSDDAHQLWQKVIDTRMFSFFEFDMASRYLRVGAPTAPAAPLTRASSTETI